MAEQLRIGVLGLTHDHVWGNLNELAASTRGQLVAAADPHEELLVQARNEHGCPSVYQSYEELLEKEELDAVYIYSDNAAHEELCIMAAKRGLHVLVEKPLASTLTGAKRMLAACSEAGVQLMVNWPFAWWPGLQRAMSMVEDGELGRLTGVKYRAAHAGPKELGCTHYFYDWLHDQSLNGAGAFMDYCCYGTALARHMLGVPNRVTGVAGNLNKDYVTVDDNAVVVMQWPRAMAISEGSWAQIGHMTSYVATFFGTKGTLVVEPGKNGRVMLANEEHEYGEPIDVPASPPNLVNATEYFLSCIQDGVPVQGLCSAQVARDAQEILEAGLASSQNGQAMSLPLPVYWKGAFA